MNSNTDKAVESANVKVNNFVVRSNISCKEEYEGYSTFIYMDDGTPNTPNE